MNISYLALYPASLMCELWLIKPNAFLGKFCWHNTFLTTHISMNHRTTGYLLWGKKVSGQVRAGSQQDVGGGSSAVLGKTLQTEEIWMWYLINVEFSRRGRLCATCSLCGPACQLKLDPVWQGGVLGQEKKTHEDWLLQALLKRQEMRNGRENERAQERRKSAYGKGKAAPWQKQKMESKMKQEQGAGRQRQMGDAKGWVKRPKDEQLQKTQFTRSVLACNTHVHTS